MRITSAPTWKTGSFLYLSWDTLSIRCTGIRRCIMGILLHLFVTVTERQTPGQLQTPKFSSNQNHYQPTQQHLLNTQLPPILPLKLHSLTATVDEFVSLTILTVEYGSAYLSSTRGRQPSSSGLLCFSSVPQIPFHFQHSSQFHFNFSSTDVPTVSVILSFVNDYQSNKLITMYMINRLGIDSYLITYIYSIYLHILHFRHISRQVPIILTPFRSHSLVPLMNIELSLDFHLSCHN